MLRLFKWKHTAVQWKQKGLFMGTDNCIKVFQKQKIKLKELQTSKYRLPVFEDLELSLWIQKSYLCVLENITAELRIRWWLQDASLAWLVGVK